MPKKAKDFLDKVLNVNEESLYGNIDKFCTWLDFSKDVLDCNQACFAFAAARHHIKPESKTRVKHSLSVSERKFEIATIVVLDNQYLSEFLEQLYGTTYDVYDSVFIELEEFFNVLDTNVKDILQVVTFSDMLTMYFATCKSKIDYNKPPRDLVKLWLKEDINCWIKQTIDDLESELSGLNAIHAAYRRLLANMEGHTTNVYNSTEEAEQLWEAAWKPQLHAVRLPTLDALVDSEAISVYARHTAKYYDEEDLKKIAVLEISGFYRSIGLQYLDLTKKYKMENILMYYVLWVGKGYEYPKVVDNETVTRSYK